MKAELSPEKSVDGGTIYVTGLLWLWLWLLLLLWWLLLPEVMNESKSTTEKGRKGHPRRHVTAVVNAASAAVACPIAR